MDQPTYDVAIVGAGIVGLATALRLSELSHARIIVLEAEQRLGAHQTGHNSGVIHSGLYYKPGSLKAANCTAGREMMVQFCEKHGIKYERCGKIVVATKESELPALEELERRGQANGLAGVRRMSQAEMRELEPNVAGILGLHVPETGIVNYREVLEKYAELVNAAGHEVWLGARATRFLRDGSGSGIGARAGTDAASGGAAIVIETTRGAVRCRNLIGSAGLQSDRVSRATGCDPGVQIVPFRGEYYDLAPERRALVRNLIYPVPDSRFPFLGVHYTRRVDGSIEAGPNAVLAFKREGYTHFDISPRDMLTYGTYPGFWKMVAKFWRMGAAEMYRSFSKQAFLDALRELTPSIQMDDIKRGGAGVRAQALDNTGKLLDDFHLIESNQMIHVLNAPSPAATASLSIGQTIARKAIANFGLEAK